MSLLLYREEIDRIDEELLTLLESRFRVCEAIAREKNRTGVPIEDKVRERQLLSRASRALGKKTNISSAVLDVYIQVLERSKHFQEDIS